MMEVGIFMKNPHFFYLKCIKNKKNFLRLSPLKSLYNEGLGEYDYNITFH